MPIDLTSEPTAQNVAVIDRLDNALPFSRGILATSILATGARTPSAYEIAQAVLQQLREHGRTSIRSDELTELTAERIRQDLSPDLAESYLLWRRARRIGRPMIITLFGSSGVGKSTLATRLALRLGVNRVVTTDAIREVLRTVISEAFLPELHVSSYETLDPDAGGSRASTYHRQARAVSAACAAVARRYVKERKHAIFEGVHLLPGHFSRLLKGTQDRPIVVEVLLSLNDRDLHGRRLSHREITEPSRQGSRHLAEFEAIRSMQETMRCLAQRAGVPEFDVGADEDLTQQIVRQIVAQALS